MITHIVITDNYITTVINWWVTFILSKAFLKVSLTVLKIDIKKSNDSESFDWKIYSKKMLMQSNMNFYW